ncbi:DUF188 domain-containing protein [Macrococcus sp. DPC7161]|uniref:DUF188 domain-containing protein n=1 Tax=Macrococcus sp. DPC7161 TaxID=2507060 RepID=UPI00100B083A|nr:DUF188 domain-containing protein [Macrococcus sp. DPC7161]RXK17977.1 YaiI/YqxD family protein [Macrococcus sp. DPC7161]
MVNKIFIDADSSPVIEETIEVIQDLFLETQQQIKLVLIKDYAHYTNADYPEFVATYYVDTGHDSADYKITAMTKEHDLVITGDYGLASLLLNKSVEVLHHNGTFYSIDTIDLLLQTRHDHLQLRKAKKRVRGPKKFTHHDRENFKRILKKHLS